MSKGDRASMFPRKSGKADATPAGSETEATGAETRRALARVAGRLRAASIGGSFYLFTLVLAAVYAVLLVLSRLLAVLPARLGPPSLVAVPAAALLLALAFHRRPRRAESARAIDARGKTEDLFLTVSSLEGALGRFQPLVAKQAEAFAPSVRAREVVPFRWAKRARNASATLGVLAAGALFLPQLDPFGKEEARRIVEERAAKLVESSKETSERAARLAAQDPRAEHAPPVAKAVEELKNAFKTLEPANRQGNLKKLETRQGEIGDLWRKVNEEQLRNALARTQAGQSFGAENEEKAAEWKKGLEQGDASAVKRELGELKKLAESIGDSTDPRERQERARQLEGRLKKLSDFLSSEIGSKSARKAVRRALDQLQASGTQGLSERAIEALQGSLDLADLEMDSLAQGSRDLAQLESALKALQEAKRANAESGMEGADMSKVQTLGDYERMFAKMCGKKCARCGRAGCDGKGGICRGDGAGPGMKGPGRGKGGKAPENESAESDFQTEKSSSPLQAGKMLLEWKSRGLSEKGRAVEDYESAVDEVRQGVSEAIVQEEVPPGYHDAIRKYFDTLGEARAGDGR